MRPVVPKNTIQAKTAGSGCGLARRLAADNGNELKRRGINPWLDKEQIPPGRWFQDRIQKAIPTIKSAAVFIGTHGLGRWQTLELRAFISQCVERDIPVIPVLLPGVTEIPEELLFLKELNYVQFVERVNEPDALDQFEFGITGKHPKRGSKHGRITRDGLS